MDLATERKIYSSAVGLSYLVSCLPENLQTLEYEEEIFAAAGERIVELEERVKSLEAQIAAGVTTTTLIEQNTEKELRRAYFETPLDPDEYRA